MICTFICMGWLVRLFVAVSVVCALIAFCGCRGAGKASDQKSFPLRLKMKTAQRLRSQLEIKMQGDESHGMLHLEIEYEVLEEKGGGAVVLSGTFTKVVAKSLAGDKGDVLLDIAWRRGESADAIPVDSLRDYVRNGIKLEVYPDGTTRMLTGSATDLSASRAGAFLGMLTTLPSEAVYVGSSWRRSMLVTEQVSVILVSKIESHRVASGDDILVIEGRYSVPEGDVHVTGEVKMLFNATKGIPVTGEDSMQMDYPTDSGREQARLEIKTAVSLMQD